MATDPDFIDYAAEQIALGDRLSHKKMFGEYALYVDGKVVAFACDNSLFVKPSAAADTLAPDLPRRPPYPGAKLYLRIDADRLEDPEWLADLVRRTTAEVPLPKPKSKSKVRK